MPCCVCCRPTRGSNDSWTARGPGGARRRSPPLPPSGGDRPLASTFASLACAAYRPRSLPLCSPSRATCRPTDAMPRTGPGAGTPPPGPRWPLPLPPAPPPPSPALSAHAQEIFFSLTSLNISHSDGAARRCSLLRGSCRQLLLTPSTQPSRCGSRSFRLATLSSTSQRAAASL